MSKAESSPNLTGTSFQKVRFFGLLYIEDGESFGENSFTRRPSETLLEYVRCSVTLSRSLNEAGFDFTLLSNDPSRVQRIAESFGHLSLNVQSIDFSLEVPTGFKFFGAHYKLDVFRHLASLEESGWFALLDLDVIFAGQNPSILEGAIRSRGAFYLDISDQIWAQFGKGRVAADLRLLHEGASSGVWAGGEFVGGPSSFFKSLSEAAFELFPRYLAHADLLHHQGDEMVTSAALEILVEQGLAVRDAGTSGLASRYWSRWRLPFNSYGLARIAQFQHLPSDKAYLASLATTQGSVASEFKRTYGRYRARKLTLEAAKTLARPIVKLRRQPGSHERWLAPPTTTRFSLYSLVFPPDAASTAFIVGSIVDRLSATGHHTVVLTSTPHYSATSAGQSTLDGQHANVVVRRQPMKEKSASTVARFVAWGGFAAVTLARGVREPRAAACLVVSPPLFVGVSAAGIKALRGTPYVYVVQEALSDLLEQLGLVPRPAVVAIQLMERLIYRQAAAVVAISISMKKLLVQAGVPEAKIHVIENFAFGQAAPAGGVSASDASAEPMITYLGNMGPAQDLDTVVEAAALLGDVPIHIVLAGNGTRVEEIRAKAASLPNVEVRDPMPLADALALTAASTACLVLQTKGTGSSALPSKIYQIMSSGRPVLAVCDTNSGVANILAASGAGVSVEPGDAAGLARQIRHLVADPARVRAMGAAGVSYVNEHATEEVVTSAYLHLHERVAAAHTGRGLLRGWGTRSTP